MTNLKRVFSLLFFITTLINLNLYKVQANTIEIANNLFNDRALSEENSLKAANIYETLANNTHEIEHKIKLLTKSSLSLYYFGTHSDNNELKKTIHERGWILAEKATKLYELYQSDLLDNELLAKALMQQGANMGKWGEANGIGQSLVRWPELEKIMKRIIKLGQASVNSYGPYRILGRAYFVLPSPLGSREKSERYLKRAYKKSLNQNGKSIYGLNVIYYAEVLISRDKSDIAKDILLSFLSSDPETINLERIPETKEEFEIAKNLLDKIK